MNSLTWAENWRENTRSVGRGVLAFVAAAYCSGCSGEQPPSGSGSGSGYDTDCDTVAPPVTTGGDYGDIFPAPALDFGGDKLDLGEEGDIPNFDFPPSGVDPPRDPESWSYVSGEDSYYRSPTSAELDDHAWLSETDILLIPPPLPLRSLAAGISTVTLPIPMYDRQLGWPQDALEFRTLVLHSEFSGNMPLIEQRWEDDCLRRHSHLVPFTNYLSTSARDIEQDSVVAVANASSFRDSLAIFGGAFDRTFTIRGPYTAKRVSLEVRLPPGEKSFYILDTAFDPSPAAILYGGQAASLRSATGDASLIHASDPASAPVGQCDDGLDNDADGEADGCDLSCVERFDYGGETTVHNIVWESSKNIGFFGGMSYCTANESAYPMEFVEWGQFATKILNNVGPSDESMPAAYDPSLRPPPVRIVMAGCAVAKTQDIADECDRDNGNCVVPGYTFESIDKGDWDTNSGLLSLAWSYVTFLIDGGYISDVQPIQTAVIFVNKEGSGNSITSSPDGGAVPYDGENGLGVVGATVVSTLSDVVGPAAAHEIGHSFGLAHDDVNNGFMNAGGGFRPELDWDAPSLFGDTPGNEQGPIWQTGIPLKTWPRPAGFEFTGCQTDQDCDFAPGLSCGSRGVCK